jgi:hypothetical protein
MGLIIFLLVGGIAGWLAGKIMQGEGYGLVADIYRRMVVWQTWDRLWRIDWGDHHRSYRSSHPHCRSSGGEARAVTHILWCNRPLAEPLTVASSRDPLSSRCAP